LPAAQLDALTCGRVPRRVDRGVLLVTEGEAGDALYVIAKGAVVIYRSSADGGRVALAEMRPPEAFGDLALLGAPAVGVGRSLGADRAAAAVP